MSGYVQCWLLLILVVSLSNGCFITNCPQGGKKRSMDMQRQIKQCMRCGPMGARCFGPSLCCGPLVGCYKNTPETEVCNKEDDSHIPCSNRVDNCHAVQRGQCVTRGYCCNQNGDCKEDETCKLNVDSLMEIEFESHFELEPQKLNDMEVEKAFSEKQKSANEILGEFWPWKQNAIFRGRTRG